MISKKTLTTALSLLGWTIMVFQILGCGDEQITVSPPDTDGPRMLAMAWTPSDNK